MLSSVGVIIFINRFAYDRTVLVACVCQISVVRSAARPCNLRAHHAATRVRCGRGRSVGNALRRAADPFLFVRAAARAGGIPCNRPIGTHASFRSPAFGTPPCTSDNGSLFSYTFHIHNVNKHTFLRTCITYIFIFSAAKNCYLLMYSAQVLVW